MWRVVTLHEISFILQFCCFVRSICVKRSIHLHYFMLSSSCHFMQIILYGFIINMNLPSIRICILIKSLLPTVITEARVETLLIDFYFCCVVFEFQSSHSNQSPGPLCSLLLCCLHFCYPRDKDSRSRRKSIVSIV